MKGGASAPRNMVPRNGSWVPDLPTNHTHHTRDDVIREKRNQMKDEPQVNHSSINIIIMISTPIMI